MVYTLHPPILPSFAQLTGLQEGECLCRQLSDNLGLSLFAICLAGDHASDIRVLH